MSESNFWTSTAGRRTSRRGLLRAGALTGAGLGGAALIGCGDDDAPSTPAPGGTPATGTPTPGGTAAPGTETPGAGEPRQGGVLRLNVQSNPSDNFNIVSNTNMANYILPQHLYDTMFSPRVGRDRNESLEAAESVEVVDDTTIVFTLKEGLVYQDRAPVNGRAVVAEDIATFFEYVRDADTAIDRSFQISVLDTVEATDDRTVVYRMQRPYAYAFSGAGFGYPHNNAIVPSELVLGDLDAMEPVGSGPYQLKAYQHQVQYEFERNPTYRDADRGLPYINEVVRTVVTDSTALESAFRGEQLTVAYAPQPEIADRIIADLGEQIDVLEFLSLQPIQSTMSSKREWTQDIRAREATYRLHNMDEYISLILDGRGVPNLSLVQAGLDPYQLDPSETEPYRRHDAEEARQLLDAAGFDFNAERELTTAQGGGAGRNEVALQILAEQLRRVGVNNVTYKVLPTSEFLNNVSNPGAYDWGLWANQPSDVPQRMLRLNHTNTLTLHDSTNIRDPEVDALIEASEAEVNYEAHVELVKDLQRMLLEKYAHTQLVWAAQERQLHWSYLHNFEPARQIVSMHNAEAWMEV